MLYVAFATEALARFAGADMRTAYTAGLLRPLGFMVLDRAGRGHVNWQQRFNSSRWPSYSEWEGSIFGIANCEVAALILNEWKFPSELASALRAQHLARAGDDADPLACLLNVAGGLSEQAGHAFVGEKKWWGRSPDKLRRAGLNEEDLMSAMETTETAFQAALAALAA
jgi:HD-like signal output (HDOD) protein